MLQKKINGMKITLFLYLHNYERQEVNKECMNFEKEDHNHWNKSLFQLFIYLFYKGFNTFF